MSRVAQQAGSKSFIMAEDDSFHRPRRFSPLKRPRHYCSTCWIVELENQKPNTLPIATVIRFSRTLTGAADWATVTARSRSSSVLTCPLR